MTAELVHGRMQEVLDLIPDDTFHACVTDPPYCLDSIRKRFGAPAAAAAKHGTDGSYARLSRGFMGQAWDDDVAMRPETWAHVLRVLRPGAHLVAFGGTRTYHRLACAIEDAGFEIRDCLQWLYGQGFPKSLDISKAIDKAARGVPQGSANPSSVNHGKYKGGRGLGAGPGQFMREPGEKEERELVDEALPWTGWGTALKPACEMIVLARKPIERINTENVLKWGTGAINIKDCRVDSPAGEIGRWPANVLHDGSDEVVALFPNAPGQIADASIDAPSAKTRNVYGQMNRCGEKSADRRYTDNGGTNFAMLPGMRRNDAGSAARFFYAAKSTKAERDGSSHPTVKPLALMRWLVRLTSQPGISTILDPFAGTGTTGAAAVLENVNSFLIEQSETYHADARRRLDRAIATAAAQPAVPAAE